jgi:hypothetical protein
VPVAIPEEHKELLNLLATIGTDIIFKIAQVNCDE